MQIQHFKIENPALQAYIDYYYLLSTEDDSKDSTYTAFPSENTPVGFFSDCNIHLESAKAIVTKKKGEGIKEVIVGNATAPVYVTLPKGIKEFCIVFKPLGINYTQTTKLGGVLQQPFSNTTFFTDLYKDISAIINGENTLHKLEEKLATMCSRQKELNVLASIVRLMMDNENITIKDIARQIYFTEKSIYRLFLAHIGISPVQFRGILKFRQAVKKSTRFSYTNKMSRMAADNGYYDQANLVNEFKKFTNSTPKRFLSAVTLNADKKIVWKFD